MNDNGIRAAIIVDLLIICVLSYVLFYNQNLTLFDSIVATGEMTVVPKTLLFIFMLYVLRALVANIFKLESLNGKK